MRLALLLPDGVGVRNFLLGGFAGLAGSGGRLDIIHVVPEELVASLDGVFGSDVHWHRLERSGDGRLVTTLRNSLAYAHMYWARTEAMRRRLERPVRPSSLGRWAMTQTARAVGRMAASPSGIASLEQCHRRVASQDPAVKRYRRLFAEARPDVLLCSNQRPPEVVAPVLAARDLGIPTAAFIFSWDNLTSKGRIVAPFEHYLVWSDHMAAELRRYYPAIDPGHVHLVGSPQFDPYGDPTLRVSRREFCGQLALDPQRPIICYSGGDAGTCPDDPRHVRLLMQEIRAGSVRRDPQVVLRPSPVDDGARYADVRRDFPELRYAAPAWLRTVAASWSEVIPLPADVAFLANLARHSDLNINVASTMTLDFAIHDKPVVNIAFDVSRPPPLGAPIHGIYYQYEHYRPVVELGAARIARSSDEFVQALNAYLADPALDRDGRRRLVELELGSQSGTAGARIVAALRGIVTRAPARTPASAVS